MAEEGTYEYACMRAELLGLEKPDREEFLKEMQEKLALQENSEEIELRQNEELDSQGENLKNITGGLDELNSILTITQRKLNKFKTACGSLTNLLKIKVGQGDSTESVDKNDEPPLESNASNEQNPQESDSATENTEEGIAGKSAQSQNVSSRRQDFNKTIDSQMSSLDSLLTKADNAHYSMAHQNKQMKNFLK